MLQSGCKLNITDALFLNLATLSLIFNNVFADIYGMPLNKRLCICLTVRDYVSIHANFCYWYLARQTVEN